LTKLYVGNLSWGTTEETLRKTFEQFGALVSVKIIMDKMRGTSKGFGFIEYTTPESAQTAMAQLNNTTLDGRPLNIKEALPQTERPRQGFGGGYNNRSRPERQGGAERSPSYEQPYQPSFEQDNYSRRERGDRKGRHREW
jgi:cold-inducible RNA-binding protein